MIDTRNYGNRLFEQDNDISATQEEINKWLSEPAFLEKVQKMDDASVEFRKVHDGFPYFRTITHRGKKVRFIASADGSEVYLMPEDTMSRNPTPERYFEVTGDALGQQAIQKSLDWQEEQKQVSSGEKLYKEDKINYKALVITLEGILFGDADKEELAYYVVAIRSVADARNYDYAAFRNSLNVAYKNEHDADLFDELTKDINEFSALDKIIAFSSWHALGEFPSSIKNKTLKQLDLSDAGACAKVIRNVVKEEDPDDLSYTDAFKVAAIVTFATHKQLIEIDEYLQKYYSIDLFDEVKGLDTTWGLGADKYTEAFVLAKVSRTRQAKFWKGPSINSGEGAYSINVWKYIKKFKKETESTASSNDNTSGGQSPQDIAGGSRY